MTSRSRFIQVVATGVLAPSIVLIAAVAPVLADPCCLAQACIDEDPAVCTTSGGVAGYCIIGAACGGTSCDSALIQPLREVKCVKANGRADVRCQWLSDPNANAYDGLYVLDKLDIPVSTEDLEVPGSAPTTVAEFLHVGAVPGAAGTVNFYKPEGLCLGSDTSWHSVSMSPSVFMFDMEFPGGGNIGYAIGGQQTSSGETLSTVLRTQDGSVWDEALLPDPTATALNGLDFVDTTTGWVVGDNGKIFKTTNGGVTWAEQSSGTTSDLKSVSFVSALEGWACGTDGDPTYLVLYTDDGGATWTDRSLGVGGYGAQDVQFVDALRGWLAVRDSTLAPHVYRTTDGGLNWIDASFIPPEMGGIQDLEFVSPDRGFAVGYSSPAGVVLRTDDGGDTWAEVHRTNVYYNDAIDCQVGDPDRCAIAAFDLFGNRALAVITYDGGDSWVSRNAPMTAYMHSIQYVGEQLWIGASDYSQVWHSGNDGLAWDYQYHAPLWWSIGWRDDTIAWTSAISHVHRDGYAERTDDGGTTWLRDPGHPGGVHVQFTGPSDGFACSYGRSPPVWGSDDGGVSWPQRSTLGSTFFEGCFFADATRGSIFGGNGVIQRTDDGARSWSAPLPLGSSVQVTWMQFLDRDRGFVACGSGGDGYLASTIDGGANWVDRTPSIIDHYRTGYFLDGMYGLIGAFGAEVYRTTDGGASFNLVADWDHYDTAAIYIHDPQWAWVAVRNRIDDRKDARGFIYVTSDGGDTWTQEWRAPWIDSSITALTPSTDRTTLWAVGENDQIMWRNLP